MWLGEYLCSYPNTLLLVSHDADFLDTVCTNIIHLEDKKLHTYRGGYTQVSLAYFCAHGESGVSLLG